MPESAAFSTVQKHIYTCVCICMYVYTYIYIYMSHTCPSQLHLPDCKNISIHVCVYAYMYINIYTYTCLTHARASCIFHVAKIYLYMCVYMYAYIYIYTYLTHAQVSCILHVANELHQNKHRQKKFCIPPKESFATDPYIPSKEPYIPSKEPNILHQRDVSFAKKTSVESALNNSKHCSKQLFPLLKNPTLKAP